MMRGTLISERPAPDVETVTPFLSAPLASQASERLLDTIEANKFLRRAPGFLEKRRCSGIDSPPYIQSCKRGPVRYRVADLLAWEEQKLRTNTGYER